LFVNAEFIYILTDQNDFQHPLLPPFSNLLGGHQELLFYDALLLSSQVHPGQLLQYEDVIACYLLKPLSY
jgi:hypothetical protein